MRAFRSLATFLIAVVVIAAPALAQEAGEERLGGGSDLHGGVTVQLPQGGRLPAIHYIFADNPAGSSIEVEFRAEASPGITIEPEWENTTIPANGIVENYFAVSVAPEMAAGSYPVVVQLVRSDIEEVPGQITNIPAIQTTFTVEVSGATATVIVRSVSALSGEPVPGTITLSSKLSDGQPFEINRAEGSALEMRVAPGDYRAAFLLGGREIAAKDVAVEEDEEIEVVLEVEAISFVLAAIRPAVENGRPVVVDLITSVNNEAGPVPGPTSLRTRVLHNGIEVDLVTLKEIGDLPVGLTEAIIPYRPPDGLQPGTYVFIFELVTPEFILTAPDQPSLEVPPLGDLGQVIGLAVVILLILLLLALIIRAFLAARRRRKDEAVEPTPQDSRPTALPSDGGDEVYEPRHARVEVHTTEG